HPYEGLDLAIHVNLSPRQFIAPELLANLDEIVAASGVDAAMLRLEVQEQTLMQNTDLATSLIAKLAQRGVRVVIDEFGTALSSIAFLQRVPVAAVKIDRAYIGALDRDPYSLGVVETVLALARSLSVDAIAGGVETLEQLQALRALGARQGQGHLFSEPLGPEAASDLVLDRVRE
ncbi:MAG: EAL domain-containing protein, partial [Longimicrobiales bacterium]